MTWRENLLRTPTWPVIAIQVVLGLMFLGLAVIDITVHWDLVETHDDGLLLLGKAAVGGLCLGGALEMTKRRIAVGRAPTD